MNQTSARSSESAPTNVEVKGIPFSELPNQSRLFLEYLRDPGGLKKYYPNAVHSPLDVSTFAAEVLTNYKVDRERLCNALVDINKQAGSGEKTFANIELLRGSHTVAVVTGQQAGLFTGPLYTIYKALSAIRLSEELNANGTKAVPVFWAATEDHDFDEVAEMFVTNVSGERVRLQYKPSDRSDELPVGERILDATIADVIDELFTSLPVTESSSQLRQLLTSAYKQDTSFGLAFERIVATLLADFGLIIVDPLHDELKRLAAPIYKEAITHAARIVSAIGDRNKDLETNGFHTQVLVESDYFPLFWHDDKGSRTALKKADDGVYRPRSGTDEFTVKQLEELAVSDPRRFSPGVMLRPVVQDYLLPTFCYFGGAAEIAYFAQNGAVYETLRRPVTPIFHRQSFTIVESRNRRILNKFGWDLSSLFAGRESVTLDAAAKVLSPETADLFAEIDATIKAELDRLDKQLSASDPTLAANLATRRRKILHHIETLRKKALMSEVRKDETMHRQIDDLFGALVPGGALQERSANIFAFLNKHGFGFVGLLYDAIDLNDKDHRIIYL